MNTGFNFGFGGKLPQPKKIHKDSDSSSDSEEEEEIEYQEKKIQKIPQKKITYLSTKNFASKFSKLFNNSEYSDCTITFKKSKKLFNGHKIILCSSCDFFEKEFEKKDNWVLPEDEDEETFMLFLKFLYTGAFDYTQDDKVVKFILTCNRYGAKEVEGLKIPSRKLLKFMIDYIEEDNSRMKDFEKLLRFVDFGVFEKDDLLLIFKRVQWMTDSKYFLKAILQKDVDELYDNDDDDDGTNEKEEQIEFENIFKSEEEQMDVGGSCMKFDKKYCGSKIALSKGGKVAIFSGSAWQGSVLGTSGVQFTVKVHTNSTNSMIGFSHRNFNKEMSNYNTNGYFMYFSGLTLYSGGVTQKMSGNVYGNKGGQYRNVQVGDTVGVKYDKRKKQISFYLNGKSLGVAYTNVKDKKLYPCVDFYTMGSKLELVRGKYKKK